MSNVSRFTQFSALAVGIAAALAFGQAHASGFQLRENSVKNLGRSQAGTAVANGDAAVVSNNPGAMGFIDQNTVQADVTIIDLTAKFEGSAHNALGMPVSGGNGGDPGDATPVPAIAAVFPMHGALEKLTLGAKYSVAATDLFGYAATQLKTRAGVKVYAWMPMMAYKAKLPADWFNT